MSSNSNETYTLANSQTPADDGESSLPEGFKLSQRKFEDKYMLPRDTTEMDRLVYQHYVLRHELHGNFSAPVEDALDEGIKVCDVSCGVGVWTMEMALDFPASTFVGTDLAEYPGKVDVPQNCSFLMANTLEGLPFPDNTFDYVFQRLVVLAYKPAEWSRVVSELVRITKPGGWVELFESDGLIERPPPSYIKYENAWLMGTRLKGIDVHMVRDLAVLLTKAELTDIDSQVVSCPMGWYDRAGELMGHNMEMHRLALRQHLAPIMEMSDTEYDRWAIQISAELRERRSWINGYYAYGRKPGGSQGVSV